MIATLAQLCRTTANVRITHATPHVLTLRVRCPRGYHCGLVRMRPGVFDASSLDIEMDEFPSGRTVISQGWDLHQFQKRMAVPTFTAYLDGRDLGDVWFDVPNYLDQRRGVLEAEFGFRVDDAGEAQLRLVIVPLDRKRLRWEMIDRVEITADERREVSLPPRGRLPGDRPWLFLAGRSAEEIRRRFAGRRDFARPLATLEEIVRNYDGVPPENRDRTKKRRAKKGRDAPAYLPVDQMTAGAALATGSKVWLELARRTFRRLCAAPTWCRADHPPRLMGGENDMVIGHPMLSTSMLYHFLGAHLTPSEREMALAKVREYGRKLYDFSVLQKRYATGMGAISSHESGTLLGLGVASMVFHDEIPDAPRWLAWTHGRMLWGARHGPREGRHPWSTYGPHFLTFYACAVRDFADVDMFSIPFLRHLGDALSRCVQSAERCHEYNLRWIMAALASYADDARAASEWHELWKAQAQYRGEDHIIGWQDMLWHPRRAVARSAASMSRATSNGSHFFPDVGLALMRSEADNDRGVPALRCIYQSGLAVGGADLAQRKRYGMEQHDAHADGGVSIFVNGAAVVAPSPSQYRRGFHVQSVVTVDGGGHYMDGRVLGTNIREEWISRMLSFRDTRDKTAASGENTGAYRAELGVRRSRRRVTLLKQEHKLLIEDSIRLRRPMRVALQFQCTGRIEKRDGHGKYRMIAPSGEKLDVTIASPQRYRIRIRSAQMVLPYSYGFNVTKGKRTSPVTVMTPPRPQILEIAAFHRADQAKFRVGLSPPANAKL